MTSESFRAVCCFSGALMSNQCDVFNIFNWHYQEKNITMVDCALVGKTLNTDAVLLHHLNSGCWILWSLTPELQMSLCTVSTPGVLTLLLRSAQSH